MCKDLTLTYTPRSAPCVPDPLAYSSDPGEDATLSQGDWSWLRSSFFLQWDDRASRDTSNVTFVIFSPSLELDQRLQQIWQSGRQGPILEDPFSLYVIALDELWSQAENVLRTAQVVFGHVESVSYACFVFKVDLPPQTKYFNSTRYVLQVGET